MTVQCLSPMLRVSAQLVSSTAQAGPQQLTQGRQPCSSARFRRARAACLHLGAVVLDLAQRSNLTPQLRARARVKLENLTIINSCLTVRASARTCQSAMGRREQPVSSMFPCARLQSQVIPGANITYVLASNLGIFSLNPYAAGAVGLQLSSMHICPVHAAVF